jgi:hypothetical protein
VPNTIYQKAVELLHHAANPHGFLASVQPITNYNRVWARDGVICGLAALTTKDPQLIDTFRQTLETLANYQHETGTIPSNVAFGPDGVAQVSYGGLAGRVDAVTWFIIGVTQFTFVTGDRAFYQKMSPNVSSALTLLQNWEFNNRHLVYVPLSGNWADEYITDGYVLYDQLLRLWALRGIQFCAPTENNANKIKAIEAQILLNFTFNAAEEHYHERAYQEVTWFPYMPCSFSPAGYKNRFDAFANALALLLNLGSQEFQAAQLNYLIALAGEQPLGLVPAFWPPVFPDEGDWNLLKNNCKYEFRNYPYEFHNGGSWPMVNGFCGIALVMHGRIVEAKQLCEKLDDANAIKDFAFYENFNTQTMTPNGIPQCTWSAAGTILLQSYLHSEKTLLF